MTVQMEAVEPLSGRMLDDELAFDFDIDADGALELDGTSGEMMLPPASYVAMASPAGRRSSGALAAVDPHAALVAFAGFGDPPASLWSAPSYAIRVILRRRTLRDSLAFARRRRSADVGLYEASLRSADDAVVRNGLTLMVSLLVFAAVLIAATLHVLTGAFHLPW